MTNEDIIRMAREAGLSNDFGTLGYPYLPELIRFANLVAAAEREACAKIAFSAKTYIEAANAIRERGQG